MLKALKLEKETIENKIKKLSIELKEIETTIKTLERIETTCPYCDNGVIKFTDAAGSVDSRRCETCCGNGKLKLINSNK